MKVKFKAKPTPHLILTDVFSPEQLDGICRELWILHDAMVLPSSTGSAGVPGGLRKRNKGLFLGETYASAVISPTHRAALEVMTSFQVVKAWKPEWLSELYGSVLDHSVLVSRYDDGDCYLPHRDASLFTGLVWLHEENKPFSGGEFALTDYDLEFECKANSGIIFLSHEQHAVAPVHGHGRYTVSIFMGKPVASS